MLLLWVVTRKCKLHVFKYVLLILLLLFSGNLMGDFGARMLSKALQINKKLEVIHWDHNGTSPTGFYDIAAALEKSALLCSS